jgi:hypothetical protein
MTDDDLPLTPPKPDWWASHDNLHDLALYLVTIEGYDAHDLLDVIERPWKWSNEWDLVIAQREGENAAREDMRALTSIETA